MTMLPWMFLRMNPLTPKGWSNLCCPGRTKRNSPEAFQTRPEELLEALEKAEERITNAKATGEVVTKVCKETAWLRDCASNEGQRAFTIKLKHCQSLDGIMSAPKATGSHDLPKAINNIAQHYYTDLINEITKTERQLKSARAMLHQSMELTVFTYSVQ